MYGYKAVFEASGREKGLCLRPLEYIAVKELVPEIGRALPELIRRGRTLLHAK